MSSQVAVRLDDQLLGELDWLVTRCEYETRADAIRAALSELVRRERDREIDERIVAAYTAAPPSTDEAIPADLAVWDSLADDDFSDWP
ncbi:MAG: CopG family ribbon-helix-helix protein [Acidimicrobiia bacterium]